MKPIGVIAMAALIAVLCYFTATAVTPLEQWAQDAPLEKVTVSPGQVVQDLIKDRVPEGILAQGNITDATEIIGRRQGGKKLGSVANWEEILLPISYETWRNY
jgi:hypothetical protein